MAAQEIHYDFLTSSVLGTFNYGLYWNGSTWDGGGVVVTPGSVYAAYFEAGGGQYDPQHPIPEPHSIILFGSRIKKSAFTKSKNFSSLACLSFD